jgi:capsular exopolysaccharide synthesis family protein
VGRPKVLLDGASTAFGGVMGQGSPGAANGAFMPQPPNGGLVLNEGTLSSQFAEAYRALRANITFSSIDEPVRSLVLTSAAASEGKTTTAINLGIVVAQAGLSVLLVDADFRRPSIHELLGISNYGRHPMGLSNLIVGNAELNEVIFTSGYWPGFSVMLAGPMPPNPSELLGSQRMHAVLEELKSRVSLVIFDSPPLMVYSDALLLARMVDGVLYVLRAGNQDKSAQRRIQKQLEQAKARMLGIVFNAADVDEAAQGYGYYYQGKKRNR